MNLLMFQKIALGLAGLTAVAIGSFVLLEPYVFYEGYGVVISHNVNLLSDLRGQGANLAALGIIIIAGLIYSPYARVSAVIATTVFIAFPVGRVISIVLDGVPSDSMLVALIVEVVIAVMLLLAFAMPSKHGSYKSKQVVLL